MVPLVTLYSRPQCHLCDEARLVVERVCAAKNVTWQEINIDADPQLQERYGEFIPVVTVSDEQVSYWRIEAPALETAIDRTMAPSQPSAEGKGGEWGWIRRRKAK